MQNNLYFIKQKRYSLLETKLVNQKLKTSHSNIDDIYDLATLNNNESINFLKMKL